MDCSRPNRATFSPLSNRRCISVQPPSRPESSATAPLLHHRRATVSALPLHRGARNRTSLAPMSGHDRCAGVRLLPWLM